MRPNENLYYRTHTKYILFLLLLLLFVDFFVSIFNLLVLMRCDIMAVVVIIVSVC